MWEFEWSISLSGHGICVALGHRGCLVLQQQEQQHCSSCAELSRWYALFWLRPSSRGSVPPGILPRAVSSLIWFVVYFTSVGVRCYIGWVDECWGACPGATRQGDGPCCRNLRVSFVYSCFREDWSFPSPENLCDG